MADKPLDYASPGSVRMKRVPTPEQVRFRRRMRLGLLLALVLLLIPYPTEVCPPVKIQVVDENGKPLTDVISLHWEGYTDGEVSGGSVQFDMTESASLPRQWIWMSVFGRVAHSLSAYLPHHGGPGPSAQASLSFNIPAEYAVDDRAMGLIFFNNFSADTMKEWKLPQTGDRIAVQPAGFDQSRKVFWLEIEKPGRWGSANYKLKIILRRQGSSSSPPTGNEKPDRSEASH